MGTTSRPLLSISSMAQILLKNVVSKSITTVPACRQGNAVSHRAMGVISPVPWVGEKGETAYRSLELRYTVSIREDFSALRGMRGRKPWSKQEAQKPHAEGWRVKRPRAAERRGLWWCGGACKMMSLPLFFGWRSGVRSDGRTRYAIQQKTRLSSSNECVACHLNAAIERGAKPDAERMEAMLLGQPMEGRPREREPGVAIRPHAPHGRRYHATGSSVPRTAEAARATSYPGQCQWPKPRAVSSRSSQGV